MAIIRSRKASPGLTVTRTTIQSDNTCVPPVTALKSPPDSRMTGADSPVMADSFTEATPSITSPSAGICHRPRSARRLPCAGPDYRSAAPGNRAKCRRVFLPAHFFRAAQRCRLCLAAAFRQRFGKICKQYREPEPSVMLNMNPAGASPWPPNAWKNRTVVKMLPI